MLTGEYNNPVDPDGTRHEQTETALLPAPLLVHQRVDRPTLTGTGGSDPLWLCWRGKPWLAIRRKRYAPPE
jgi:hypothetical protein